MARKRRRKGRGRFIALPIETVISLGALAQDIVASANITGFGNTKFRVVAADLSWTLNAATATEGPVMVGIANADLSDTEIQEALDASPVSASDIIALERMRRPVRIAGTFSLAGADETLNDGKAIRTKLHTVLEAGIELDVWARNKGQATLTTGGLVTVLGKLYGYWL